VNAGCPRTAAVPHLLVECRARDPHACAVWDGAGELTYTELDQRANALAHFLIGQHDVRIGDRVGVLGSRGAEAIVAMAGILQAGAAYVPLDPDYPIARLATMTEDIGIRVTVVVGEHQCGIPGVATIRCPDEGTTRPPALHRDLAGDDLAYVLFTSGSTGRPKAVGIRHRSIIRLVRNTNYIEFRADDRILHVSPLSFDASTFEIWGALLNGACVVVADPHVMLWPDALERILRTRRITVGWFTTAIFHHLAGRRPDVFGTLRTAIFGGETASADLVRAVLGHRPPARLLNAYGPTENTTFTTTYLVEDLDPGATTVPIGTPIANTTCHILRADGTTAGIGEIGELCVGGEGVAVGYLNDPQLTAEMFMPDPFSDDESVRLYRTGDLASLRPDGVLEFHGRRDTQLKFHGYRIEAAEVEKALRAHPGIADAAVTVHAPAEGKARLVAYIVPGAEPATTADLRRGLAGRLPAHAVPTDFVWLERLPLTANGKVDRRALPPPTGDEGTRSDPEESTTLVEQIGAVWREVLRGRGLSGEIPPDSTLFSLGGNSFDALTVHQLMTSRFVLPQLTPVDIFSYPTLDGYAKRVASLRAAAED
jgi:amino acid adenylation domain-containing protein